MWTVIHIAANRAQADQPFASLMVTPDSGTGAPLESHITRSVPGRRLGPGVAKALKLVPGFRRGFSARAGAVR